MEISLCTFLCHPYILMYFFGRHSLCMYKSHFYIESINQSINQSRRNTFKMNKRLAEKFGCATMW